jgi:hypothetical protein
MIPIRLLLVAAMFAVLMADKANAQARPPISDLPNIIVGSWKFQLSKQSGEEVQKWKPGVLESYGLTTELLDEICNRIYTFNRDSSYTLSNAVSHITTETGQYSVEGHRIILKPSKGPQYGFGVNIVRPTELNMLPETEGSAQKGLSLVWTAMKQTSSSDSAAEFGANTTLVGSGRNQLRPFFITAGENEQLLGFFTKPNRDDAFYIYAIDGTTGKLVDVHVVYGTRIDTSREYTSRDEVIEQAEYNATATRNNPSGRSFLMASIAERVVDGKYEHAAIDLFNTVLPKFREWSDKANEVKPQPFKKEIPLNRQYGRFWANFIWTQDGKPQLELFEQYRGKDGSGMVMGGETLLNEDQVDELSGALKMKDEAVLALNQILKDAIGSAQSEQKKIQDNFN